MMDVKAAGGTERDTSLFRVKCPEGFWFRSWDPNPQLKLDLVRPNLQPPAPLSFSLTKNAQQEFGQLLRFVIKRKKNWKHQATIVAEHSNLCTIQYLFKYLGVTAHLAESEVREKD
ncbi:hypothetical protein RRG08_009267 [Elysia crispata]|uniref:Uncharacterized protein n=1 Tax=Elysia crispata TaxID=231223 RepID=A0AAE0ZQ24_9GAST|nr:hypothetical protein RRG08_009267 [Elysia crispata]